MEYIKQTYYTICIFRVLIIYVECNLYNLITNHVLWRYDVGMHQGYNLL